jgi:uracil-DNA glycosylase
LSEWFVSSPAHGGAIQPDLFGAVPMGGTAPDRLLAWQPAQWLVAPDWRGTVDAFWESPAGLALGAFITERLADGACIYPSNPLRALALTPLSAVKVVILGQDPYHGPGQAEGLAFSVAAGTTTPPSLRNIFKELAREASEGALDAPLRAPVSGGTLAHWAEQGVLLLNTCLTVEQGQPASHAKRGWELLTDALLRAVLASGQPVVLMLWGAHAQQKVPQMPVTASHHLVLQSNHPSPLSALRPPAPFIGCGHFAAANQWLKRVGQTPVAW